MKLMTFAGYIAFASSLFAFFTGNDLAGWCCLIIANTNFIGAATQQQETEHGK